MTRSLIALGALLALGCTNAAPCFNPSSLVTDTELLAVRLDPPESSLDLSGQEPITPSRISALIVTGVAGQFNEYGKALQNNSLETTIHVCLPQPVSNVNAEPGCPEGSPLVAQLPSVPTRQAPFVYTPPLALLQQAVAQDPVHGLGGVQVLLQLDFAGVALPIRAIKTLSYQLKGSPASINHALELVGIETSVAGQHIATHVGGSVRLVVAQATGLRPLVGPGEGGTDAAETYMAYDNSGALVTLQEHISYSFYAGNSLFFGRPSLSQEAIYSGAPGDVADEPPPGTPDPPDGLVSVEPVFPGPQGASFFVVARDGRGAVAWLEVPYLGDEIRVQCVKPQFGVKCPNLLFGCN